MHIMIGVALKADFRQAHSTHWEIRLKRQAGKGGFVAEAVGELGADPDLLAVPVPEHRYGRPVMFWTRVKTTRSLMIRIISSDHHAWIEKTREVGATWPVWALGRPSS